ncbi:hypothetical protein ACFYPB_40575 [Streptomyces olivaceoviridis]|uniref:hypothetical protein n=1 Tax=Streptomyces olivaceoviridis TaxID=1921 RepID=UPI00369D61B5
MPRTQPAPLALLAAAADLIEQRAPPPHRQRPGREARHLPGRGPSDARGLTTGLSRLGRTPAAHRQEQRQPRRQYPTLAGLTTAIERGEQ